MTTIWSICMAMITVMSMGRIICTTITMNMEKATRIPHHHHHHEHRGMSEIRQIISQGSMTDRAKNWL